ncbi:helix-turn-helix transcriptional regulator [Nocardia mexicana]|nr:AraC family transcriptional regulator [Nocardia mexicana]
MVVSGAIGSAALHAHHSAQVLIARGGVIVLRDRSGREIACRAAIVPPDVPHAVVCGTADGVLAHIDPESVAGAALADSSGRSDAVADWVTAAARLPGGATVPDLLALATTGGDPVDRHPAVSQLLRMLPERLQAGRIRFADLAREVHLSPSRLAHVFSAEIGLPFRPYLRWLRVQRAAELLAAGCSLTDVAHGAGFADSAHLTRVCRSMFGVPPSGYRGIRWVSEPELIDLLFP